MESAPIWGIPPGENPVDFQLQAIPQLQGPLWHYPEVFKKIREIYDGRRLRIAVLDTGVEDHPNLAPRVAERSFIRGESVKDRNGHGTHVLGTIAGLDEDGVIIGAGPVFDTIVGKVLGNSGGGSSDGIAAGVRYAVDEGANAINMSLGGGGRYGPMEEALAYAKQHGCLGFSAAGHDPNSGVGYPVAYEDSAAIAAMKSWTLPASFSSPGPQVDVSGPGVNIVSCRHTGGFVQMQGTSMATPWVCGVTMLAIGMMKMRGRPVPTDTEGLRRLWSNYVVDVHQPGEDNKTGQGVLMADKFLEDLASGDIEYV